YNNHIGVPLTLARMPPPTKRAVIEMGMNHAGEIAPLSRLARPQTAAVTNVGAVHTESFADGVAGVAAAKAEIFEGLEGERCAILPADSPWFAFLAGEATKKGARLRTFGEAEGADARLARLEPTKDGGAEVSAVIDGERITFQVAQSAAHWGQMSLCVLLLLEVLGVARAEALAALAAFRPLAGRGEESRIALAGGAFTLIDESYNANPLSMGAALASLAARKTKGRRIAALTDMLELGENAEAEHAGLAKAIEEGGIDRVFVAGPLMEALWARLPVGRRGARARCADELLARLAEAIAPGDVVMVKGSKASRAFVLAGGLKALGSGKGRA
ncbi:MAG: Mur ligase family protein, partial [Caulobacteraceae bacterium]